MPFKNQLHVDKLLSNVSLRYESNEFIANKIFPEVPVKQDSDLYRIYTRNFRIPETKRANKGLAREHYFEVTTASYVLQKFALKDYVSQSDEDNYDLSSLRVDVTEELTEVLMRDKEKRVFDLFTTTNWSLNTSLAGTALWSLDTTASNPFPVVETALATVLANSGKLPNFGVISFAGFQDVRNHQSVLDRYKYTMPSDMTKLTESLIGQAFGVSEFHVSHVQYDSSNKGATEVITPVFSDKCFFGYKPPRASPRAPSAGYIFTKNVPMVRRWSEPERGEGVEAIEVDMEYVPKVVASLSGYLINNIE